MPNIIQRIPPVRSEYDRVKIIKPSNLAKYLNQGWEACYTLEYQRTKNGQSTIVTRLVIGKDPKSRNGELTKEQIASLPELRMPEDPADTIARVRNPEQLFGILQVLTMNLAEPQPTDTSEDRSLRLLGGKIADVIASHMGYLPDEPTSDPDPKEETAASPTLKEKIAKAKEFKEETTPVGSMDTETE